MSDKTAAFLDFSPRLTALPVVHGSLDFAVQVREALLARDIGCLAVPLPESWREPVLEAVERLPEPAAVLQEAAGDIYTYVPIDPCQPVIAAIRLALRERIPIAFVDLESRDFHYLPVVAPDPYALRKLPLDKYLAALLPTLARPNALVDERVRRMAFELHRLELEYDRTMFVCSVTDWPWIREAYRERRPYPEHEKYFSPLETLGVDPRTLAFFLGELPFVAGLYEKARATLDADDNLSIDGVMQLVLETRDRWRRDRSDAGAWLGPGLVQTYLQYVRNLTLLNRRLSPDLYTLAVAGKQIAGDGFARKLIETGGEYGVDHDVTYPTRLKMGIGQASLPGRGVSRMVSRLPGSEVVWRSCELRPEPVKADKSRWKMLWNPYTQCSHLPEDTRFESFQTHVRDQAKAIVGQDLARTEKFTASIKDGLDIRETLRHWYSGDLYVKEIPPTRGGVEIVVFLFEPAADPETYVWQSTWSNEHANESVIAFYATNFTEDVIGPGIARARYGGVFFLFPPRPIPDVWGDRRLPRTGPLADRLVTAAIFHSREPFVAVVSPTPLKAAWKSVAKRFGKRLVHLPLARFSGRLLDRLRTVHVLNGREVRSYASRFIQEG